MNIKLMVLSLAALSTGGCSYYGSQEAGKFDPEAFGEANRQTFAAMVVDPDPQYDEDMTTSGEVASDAVEAYREGEVEQPRQSGGGMGGGMGGGGGGSGGGGY